MQMKVANGDLESTTKKVVENVENAAHKVADEFIDITDPISDTIKSGAQRVQRNLDKLQDVKKYVLQKLGVKKYQGDLDNKDEKLAETRMIIDWAKDEGFDDIISILEEKHFTFQQLGDINTSNIKDELGVTDDSYAIRIVDSIDQLFEEVNK